MTVPLLIAAYATGCVLSENCFAWAPVLLEQVAGTGGGREGGGLAASYIQYYAVAASDAWEQDEVESVFQYCDKAHSDCCTAYQPMVPPRQDTGGCHHDNNHGLTLHIYTKMSCRLLLGTSHDDPAVCPPTC